MRLALVVAAAAVLGAACTSRVGVTRVVPGDPKTHVGVPFPLMYSRFETTVAWQVTGCETALELKIIADFKEPMAAPDPDNLFVIDPASLSSPLKTSALLVGYLPTGAPSSLNATIDDHSAQVVSNLVKLGVGLAKFGAVPTPGGRNPSLTPGASADAVPKFCTPDVFEAVGKLPAVNAGVRLATTLVDDRKSELQAITKKLEDMGANADEQTKTELGKAITALGAATGVLEDAKQAQAKVLEVIAYREEILWPRSGDKVDDFVELPLLVFQRWAGPSVSLKAKDGFSVFFMLRGRDNAGSLPGAGQKIDTSLGIPVRPGALGRVTACRVAACDSGGRRIGGRDDHVLQLGDVYYLPCTSRPFSSVTCSFSTDDAGRLKSMGSANTNATAETITGSMGDVVNGATEAKQIRSDAKLKQIEAETALLKARAERDAAEEDLAAQHPRTPSPATAEMYNAQADALDADRALIESKLALEASRRAGIQ